MADDLMSIENPADRLKIIIGLAEFLIPKMARSEVSVESGIKPIILIPGEPTDN